MFSIFKKRRYPTIDLSGIATDMHSHLLPGVDDGSPDVETSLSLIKGLQELGLQQFITTPHILWDLYRNDENTIGAALTTLKAALTEAGQDLKLYAAAEYMIDDHFSQILQNKEPLRCISDNYVLVEFSFVSPPYDWKKIFFDLQILGYQPILAHPERYNYLSAKPEIFQEIVDTGVLLQVNLNSLTGYYGKLSLSLATSLIKQKLVSLLGTDLHHERHLDALKQSSSLMDHVGNLLDQGTLINHKLLKTADSHK